MGVSASFFQRFQSKYTFIEYTDDRNFGLVKIYRKVELNYDYVMILNRTVC